MRALLRIANLGMVVASLAGPAVAESEGGTDRAAADEILKVSGIHGGLVVHLGCGDGRLTAALQQGTGYLVFGLDRDAQKVEAARRYIGTTEHNRHISVDVLREDHLPLIDNLANLVVVDDPGRITMEEISRVLCPGGAACTRKAGRWVKTVKARPEGLDDWTHYLHGPDNNAVAADRVVDAPHHLQWTDGPRWARAHDFLASVSALVSNGGRLFAIVDEGDTFSVALPPRWRLVARDGFNGVVLWKRDIDRWVSHLRPFRIGPTYLPRSLVAVGDRVYACLGSERPLEALDAVTGRTVQTYAGTECTREILFEDGRLLLVLHDLKTRVDWKERNAAEPAKRILALDAPSGKQLWEKQGDGTAGLHTGTLAARGDVAVYQTGRTLVCVDATSGRERWRAERPAAVGPRPWTHPTTVIADGAVLWADYVQPTRDDKKEGWKQAEFGDLIVYNTQDGRERWRARCFDDFRSPLEVFVIGKAVWTRSRENPKEAGRSIGRDLQTGKVVREFQPDKKLFHANGHGWCYRNKATERFLLRNRGGVDFLEVATGTASSYHFTRGTCQYGILPANGLLYTPSHACNCYVNGKLNGFKALAPRRKGKPAPASPSARLERGPAYDAVSKGWPEASVAVGDWPTYRGNALRASFVETTVAPKPGVRWRVSLGGRLTAPVYAGGRCFLAQVDGHTVYALEGRSGKTIWSYVAGGRIDTPPTIHNGLALFGSADGWVYALRASDGALAWRFRAAPEDRRLVAYGQIESVWPVPGNVLVVNDEVYFAAGRSSFLDGGMRLCKVNARTGALRVENILYDRDPETGLQKEGVTAGKTLTHAALPDILSSDGKSVFLRQNRFDLEGQRLEGDVPHLFSSAGFADGDGWHRTYQLFGTAVKDGYGGWFATANQTASGRMIAFDGKAVYGFGRKPPYQHDGSHIGIHGTRYHLFASAPQPKVEVKVRKEGKRTQRTQLRQHTWSVEAGVRAKGLVLASKTLFLAGPANVLVGEVDDETAGRVLEKNADAFAGRGGALLWSVDTADGRKLGEVKLDAPPVHDGLIAAGGALFLVTTTGDVLRLE